MPSWHVVRVGGGGLVDDGGISEEEGAEEGEVAADDTADEVESEGSGEDDMVGLEDNGFNEVEDEVNPDVGLTDEGLEEVVDKTSLEDVDGPGVGEDTILEAVELVAAAVPVVDGYSKIEQPEPAHEIP